MSELSARLDDIRRGMTGLKEDDVRSVHEFFRPDQLDELLLTHWVFRMTEMLQKL